MRILSHLGTAGENYLIAASGFSGYRGCASTMPTLDIRWDHFQSKLTTIRQQELSLDLALLFSTILHGIKMTGLWRTLGALDTLTKDFNERVTTLTSQVNSWTLIQGVHLTF